MALRSNRPPSPLTLNGGSLANAAKRVCAADRKPVADDIDGNLARVERSEAILYGDEPAGRRARKALNLLQQ